MCNLNQVKSSVLECFSEKDKLEASKTFYALSELSIILEHFGLRSTQTPIPGDVLYSCARNHSHQIGDMIRYCHFKQELIDCKDIFTPIMTELGVCYTFNKDAKMVAESVGETAGLRFFVNIQQDLYFFSSTIQTGVKVYYLFCFHYIVGQCICLTLHLNRICFYIISYIDCLKDTPLF